MCHGDLPTGGDLVPKGPRLEEYPDPQLLGQPAARLTRPSKSTTTGRWSLHHPDLDPFHQDMVEGGDGEPVSDWPSQTQPPRYT